uniref:Uncharacterized protein n=1 Tax=Candidatus Kentrum sp. FW TaxID=2126338 RepID=A0A450TK18_9GAMM|nr:MAG: hypothetical protein BECKFW1821C_GA0114237_101317 [Candidatus Kentron sp. FW]
MLKGKRKNIGSIATMVAGSIREWSFPVFLLITAISVFVPFSPKMPGEGLDPSWAFGMNQAVAQGLAFGRDVIFTLGPYGSIYTKTFHPGTDNLMVWGSLYLGVSFALAAFLNFKDSKRYFQALLLLTLTSVMYLTDPIIFYYPLLVGTYIFKATTSTSEAFATIRWHALLIALFTPFGLLLLIKGSALIICCTVIVLSIVLLGLRRDWKGVALVCLSSLISLVFFWIVAAQPLSALPSYFISMLPIISGYTEAMSVIGNAWEIFFYTVGVTILLWSVFRQTNSKIIEKIILLLMFFVVLFIAFKGGFIRHDGHAIIAGTMILLSALLAGATFLKGLAHFVLFAAVFVWLHIDFGYIKTNPQKFLHNIAATYTNAWNGLQNRIFDGEKLARDFEERIAGIHKKSDFPILDGTTDIYSYDQSYLISSENQWNPRPIIQSYSAYTPALLERNKAHLLGHDRPDNLIFKVQTIDHRIPSLDDGASWPAIFSNYRPASMKNGYLVLRKQTSGPALSECIVSRGKHVFGELVSVPDVDGIIFAKINIHQSVLGWFASILFKPSQLQITITMKNGATRRYRIVSGMAKTGFLLSPLIENTEEFGLIYAAGDYLGDKKVSAISINPENGRSFWYEGFDLEFVTFKLPRHSDALDLYGFSQPVLQKEDANVLPAKRCDGHIDVINGVSPAPASFETDSLLDVRGWLAISTEKGLVPDGVYLVLTGKNGERYLIKTNKVPRPDVGAHFKKSRLDASGYEVIADISTLKGRYALGLAYTDNEFIKLCPQSNIIAEFNNSAPRMISGLSEVIEDKPDILPMITNSSILDNSGFASIVNNARSNSTGTGEVKFSDLIVYTSSVRTGQGNARIEFSARKGERFLYRSGPKGGNQIMEIAQIGLRTVLPVSPDWASIEFDGLQFPDRFEVELSDNGDGQDEWSAIALMRKNN